MYTASPAHPTEHWVEKVQKIVSTKDCIDRIMIEDASGILTPERTRELITTVKQHCEGIPLEFHAHCNSGLAPLCYLEAIQAGVTTMHTAVAPMANGTSLPATETIVKNARRLGFESELDEDALSKVSSYFRGIAEKEGFPIGVPREYDLFHFDHQVPGGMMSNLTRQLREVGMEDRLGEILEEVIAVRKEFGYPVMATPYSQIVGVQAMENVVTGERYKKIPDETIKYVLGYYGDPVVPIDSNVYDRIMNLPRTKKFIDWKPEGFLKTVEELRGEIGPELSDDDLLLKVLIPDYRPEKKKQRSTTRAQPIKSTASSPPDTTVSPNAFNVEVDGEVFTVRVSPLGNKSPEVVESGESGGTEDLPEGAVVSDMAGLVLSVDVKTGDRIEKGDAIAMIEAMKMRRSIHSPLGGIVREVLAHEGEIVEAGSVLIAVEPV
jgi:pyruvate/oxaloacetate carboxyltransferase